MVGYGAGLISGDVRVHFNHHHARSKQPRACRVCMFRTAWQAVIEWLQYATQDGNDSMLLQYVTVVSVWASHAYHCLLTPTPVPVLVPVLVPLQVPLLPGVHCSEDMEVVIVQVK
jgi:hypothetical protein